MECHLAPKAGNGVELLRDDRDDTYWQSDGAQPHLITISFPRKVQHNNLPCLCIARRCSTPAGVQQDLAVWDQTCMKQDVALISACSKLPHSDDTSVHTLCLSTRSAEDQHIRQTHVVCVHKMPGV